MDFSAVYRSMAYLNLMLYNKADLSQNITQCALSIYFASPTHVRIIRNEEDSEKYSNDDYIKRSSNLSTYIINLDLSQEQYVFNQ
jgi:hypothetical protein